MLWKFSDRALLREPCLVPHNDIKPALKMRRRSETRKMVATLTDQRTNWKKQAVVNCRQAKFLAKAPSAPGPLMVAPSLATYLNKHFNLPSRRGF